jgi:hypothetical protein
MLATLARIGGAKGPTNGCSSRIVCVVPCDSVIQTIFETAFRRKDAAIRLRAGLSAAVSLSVFMVAAAGARAQGLEPRSYSNAPVGLNFLIAGYAYAEGKIAFDPSSSITEAQYHTNTGLFAYARALNAWGKSAKFDMVLPYSSFSGQGLVGGQQHQGVSVGPGRPAGDASFHRCECQDHAAGDPGLGGYVGLLAATAHRDPDRDGPGRIPPDARHARAVGD